MALIRSLSGRLLLLTLIFVMLAEVLIFVPSVARYRESYLMERLERAQIASLALLATPDDMVKPELEAELLRTAGVVNIVLRRDARRELVLESPEPLEMPATFDLRGVSAWTLVIDAFGCLFAPPDRMLRVIGEPVQGGGVVIEVILPEGPLKEAMLAYGLRILALSLIIAGITAALIAISLRWFLVRPITRVIDSMQTFAEDPEDEARVIEPSSRIAEIAAAEGALRSLQTDLRAGLRQKARLAALGEALAKVSHDLRNLLATAQLLADSLDGSADPRVARVGPKIIRSLDRAATLCVSTLDFGRVEEPRPVRRTVALRALAEEVGEVVFPDGGAGGPARPAFVNAVPEGLVAAADPDHLLRILANLTRNARQAMEGASRGGEVRISARGEDGVAVIEVSDQGPGLPERAREHLFTPFKGGATRGGAGLGLAIADELARAGGGALRLAVSTTEGTRFELRLPITAAGSGEQETAA
ncbi:MAG: HAMP domain-containing sensor histidine kinase [Pseudomonadota bacterium]